MLKRLLCVISVLIILPVCAGVFEDAIVKSDNVFLYLYMKNCDYCVKFNPNYDKLTREFGKNCKFLKIDASSKYGNELGHALGAQYVPFVAMVNNKTKVIKTVNPTCLLSYSCVQNNMKKFLK